MVRALVGLLALVCAACSTPVATADAETTGLDAGDSTDSAGEADTEPVALPIACTVDNSEDSACGAYIQTWHCPAPAAFSALAMAADGGFLLVGELNHHAWAVRTDASGKVVWDWQFPVLSPVHDVVATSDGEWQLVGGTDSLGPGFVLRLDDQGNTHWASVRQGQKDAYGQPLRVVAMPDGGVAVGLLLATSTGHGSSAAVERFDAEGNRLWFTALGAGWSTSVEDLARFADGRIGLTHEEKGGAGIRSTSRWTLEASGLPVENTKTCFAERLAVSADGTIVSGCTSGYGSSGRSSSFVRQISTQGEISWLTWLNSDKHGEPKLTWWATTALASWNNGESVAQSSGKNPRWSRLDGQGHLLWQRLAPTVNDLVALPGGGIAGASGDLVEQLTPPQLVVADRWGNTTCQTGAACASLAPNGCDDGNKCTSDFCDGGACSHQALDDETPCAVDAAADLNWTFTAWCAAGQCAAN